MSFLKKLTKDFEGLMHDKDGQSQGGQESSRGHDQSYYGGPPEHQYGQPPQQHYGQPPQQYGQPQQPYGQPPQQYGQPPQPYGHSPQPYGQPYGAPPSNYSSPAPQGGYGAPPPPPPPAHEPAPLPQGWFSSWDSRRNRAYYFEPGSGRTQWEQPGGPQGYPGEAPRSDFYQEYGHAMPPTGYGQQGGYGQPGYPPPEGSHADNSRAYYGDVEQKEKKKEGHGMGTVLAAGAVGIAGGALVGAAIAHDSDSDEEHRAPPPPPSGDYYPDETRSGSSVSSSDKEELEERREELEEAQEEYDEAYEEAYD
ncbi:uncharacterized protein K452DRAFT_299293 [Aplosporella prunicola CBS 121167]|uniref:WW domain-containing protein n=1 Tax=Aplosporella prunicola CBS 121167 TaxID=1176127 RepID=A0A6A6BCA0_9PEZI|nr:uncharacterized protein K452DRAFT_299293 [Aplosporella prunicola CBS 121167]KAF2140547.1 hypothetical protein K452DRAFT_299293 [Aplosporella prunicola CBS 121167]